jgi:hypothetical protein
MRKFNVYFVFALVIVLSEACAENDPFPNVNLSVCPGAVNIETHLNDPAKGVKALTYQVSANFPARDVTEFYNVQLEKRGFKKHDDPLHALKGFEWTNFNPTTGNWETTKQLPARYFASWVNDKQDQFVWLVIDFNTGSEDNQQNGTASVSIHVTKFSAFLKDQNEIRKLRKM